MGKEEALSTRWWSVLIEADVEPVSEEVVDDLLEVLPELGGASPAIGWSPREISARFSVSAPSPAVAAHDGVDVFALAMGKVGVDVLDLFRAEAVTHERLAKELEESAGGYLGVSEVASMLGVSKQRVAELREKPGFPAPIAELAAGPVWTEASLRRFVAEWKRRPGRPGMWSETLYQLLEKRRAEGTLGPMDKLTPAEARAIELLALGAGIHDLAVSLGITAEAVRARLRRAAEKLALDVRNEAAHAGQR